MKTAEQTDRIHPFDDRRIQVMSDGKWQKLWNAATTYQEWVSLLHIGLHVQDSKHMPFRVELYFRIAEGWCHRPYRDSEERNGTKQYLISDDGQGKSVYKTEEELRYMISEKAFLMLATHFLTRFGKEKETRIEMRHEWHDVVQPWFWLMNNVLDPAMHFFRLNDCQSELVNIRGPINLSHAEKQAIIFLHNFAVFLWSWEEENPFQHPGVRLRERWEVHMAEFKGKIQKARTWMIGALNSLHRLEILRRWTGDFDEVTCSMLRELAFRTEIDGSCGTPRRSVMSLAEACFAGSVAASLLMEDESIKRVRRKF